MKSILRRLTVVVVVVCAAPSVVPVLTRQCQVSAGPAHLQGLSRAYARGITATAAAISHASRSRCRSWKLRHG